jgi:hypothetical protein
VNAADIIAKSQALISKANPRGYNQYTGKGASGKLMASLSPEQKKRVQKIMTERKAKHVNSLTDAQYSKYANAPKGSSKASAHREAVLAAKGAGNSKRIAASKKAIERAEYAKKIDPKRVDQAARRKSASDMKSQTGGKPVGHSGKSSGAPSKVELAAMMHGTGSKQHLKAMKDLRVSSEKMRKKIMGGTKGKASPVGGAPKKAPSSKVQEALDRSKKRLAQANNPQKRNMSTNAASMLRGQMSPTQRKATARAYKQGYSGKEAQSMGIHTARLQRENAAKNSRDRKNKTGKYAVTQWN